MEKKLEEMDVLEVLEAIREDLKALRDAGQFPQYRLYEIFIERGKKAYEEKIAELSR